MAVTGEMRPIERRVRRLVEAGLDPTEIAWRFRRSPRFIQQVIDCSERPRSHRVLPDPSVLRPLERRILAWRATGASYAEIAARFRRSPGFIRRVEVLARQRAASLG
jgi:hypothetical protein